MSKQELRDIVAILNSLQNVVSGLCLRVTALEQRINKRLEE